ncbi:hypothetical protein I302_102517 [Kwoniella bestiolae CBS 10118]|uniref:Xylanolytic transcriptional activator regulatory domain-containing protein n=1 Tax=Kwoniella bestiolae CBS 10118 TaxID=1296100 RepID=A0A1B9GFE9_9TREE|nr:hypothetical protein I302_01207 [Kwoniella bestiolae CBS 10118]OCF29695.1 hypothetical protein I302_01207 [Kwoniella bestiolae CBS 10118]
MRSLQPSSSQINELRKTTVELENRVNPLQERIAWLQGLLQQSNPSLKDIDSIPTGQAVTLPRAVGTNPLPPSPISLHEFVANAYPQSSTSPPPTSTHPSLPSYDTALKLAHTYLNYHCQTHHVIDQEEIEDDINKVYRENGLTAEELSASRFRVFSVMYLEMMGGADNDPTVQTCRSLAINEVKNVIRGQDLVAVQSLVFLCRFAIREPGGIGLWQLAGMAARTALALRLHRRDDVYKQGFLNPDEVDWRQNEKRKNIFWAVYNLDRLATFVLNQPPSIRDCDVDVDLPSVTPSYGNRLPVSDTAIRNHSLRLRMLYGKIQEAIYGVSVKDDRPLEERTQMVCNFVHQVDGWYRASPLKADFVPISDATVNRQLLDDISYQQMMLALHRPSSLIPEIPSEYVDKLLDAATKSITLYQHYFSRKEIPMTWIHLFQIYTSSVTLVKCFSEFRRRSGHQSASLAEFETRIGQCRDLLAQFGTKWPESQLYQVMFGNLIELYNAESELAAHKIHNILVAPSTTTTTEAIDPAFHEFLGGFCGVGTELGTCPSFASSSLDSSSPLGFLKTLGVDGFDRSSW